jgi:Flp pilus assembly protein TadB
LPANATKDERKAARRAQRAATNAERARQRQALLTGDEAHLPARDKGPARRWARDYVDARRNVGEMFLPVALVVLGMSMVPRLQIPSMVLLYAALLAMIIDSFVLRRTLKRRTEERFGDRAAGAAGYGMMRAMQMRRWRMPRPQVGRGEFPK